MSDLEHGGPAFPLSYEHRLDCEYGIARSGMTLRQYAAIHLKVPNSGDEWLDEMIREARRLDNGVWVSDEEREREHLGDPEKRTGIYSSQDKAATFFVSNLQASGWKMDEQGRLIPPAGVVVTVSPAEFVIGKQHPTQPAEAGEIMTVRQPQPDTDGFIPWDGGECPVDKGTQVIVKLEDGTVASGPSGVWNWRHYGAGADIIAYRLSGGVK